MKKLPRVIVIRVTKKDAIKSDGYTSNTHCPLAMALKRKGFKKVDVGSDDVDIIDEGKLNKKLSINEVRQNYRIDKKSIDLLVEFTAYHLRGQRHFFTTKNYDKSYMTVTLTKKPKKK